MSGAEPSEAASAAPPRGTGPGLRHQALSRRWRGQPGKLEVVYSTVSDPETGVGIWIHHELVAPVGDAAYLHGWCAVFRPPAAPVVERFGPQPVTAGAGAAEPTAGWLSTEQATLEPPALRGRVGSLGWDLVFDDTDEDGAAPLYTFPSWAWERELLPAAQVVPVPSTRFTGRLEVDGSELSLSPRAVGQVAHIYGHGNAQRWGWVHAELGGGDVLEVVAAVSRRPGLDRLPPLPFVQLRVAGRDWPRQPLAAAPLLRARLGLPHWDVGGTVGRWRLRVDVEMPPSQCVSLSYVDPDGAGATCTNTEVGDAEVVLEHRRSRWETAARWTLHGTAHAEIGTRP